MDRVYLKFVWRLLAFTVLIYCGVFIHFKGDDRVMLQNGATISDLIYYNCIKVSLFTGSLAFTFLCEAVGFTKLKYVSFTMSTILFWRMLFHIWMYEKIGTVEIYLYIISVFIIMIRALHTTKTFYQWYHRFQ